MKYQVLIVDDEFLARRVLASYVAQCADLELAGQCANAADAFAAVKTRHIDIVLLDIHMPDLSGLDLARMLKDEAVIFTTAYSQYAIESYSLDAVDYLLKPIAPDRFMQAIDKARRRLAPLSEATAKASSPEAASPLLASSSSLAEENYFTVRADYKMYKLDLRELLYIEGQHEYVSFHLPDRRITAHYTLKALEEQLPADLFMRIHKSYIAGLRHIDEVHPDAILIAGRRIPVGGIYKETLRQRFDMGGDNHFQKKT